MLYYLHIPKCAGTSVRRVFQSVYGNRLIEVYGNPHYETRTSESIFFGHFCFSLHECLHDPAPQYMTLLRDPLERVISWYRHQVRHPDSLFHRRIHDKHLSLAEIIERGMAPEVNNHSMRMICMDYSRPGRQRFRDTCSAWLCGKELYQFTSQRSLKLALERIRRFFCFVGTVNRIEALRSFVAEHSGVEASQLSIPIENTAPADGLSIDSGTRILIERANQLDRELFELVSTGWLQASAPMQCAAAFG